MNEFLTNLALRAVGLPAIVEPTPPPGWTPREEPSWEEAAPEETVESVAHSEPAQNVPALGKSGAPGPPVSPVAPPPVVSRPQVDVPPETPVRAIPDAVRENRTEHRAAVRQMPLPAPAPEVHELVREQETVRETVVEREVHTVTGPSVIASGPPTIPPPSPVLTEARLAEPVEVIRSILREQPAAVPAPPPTPASAPAPRPASAPAPTRTPAATPTVPLPPLPPMAARERPSSQAEATQAPKPEVSMTDARREQEPDVVRAAPTPEPLNLKPGIAAKEPGRTAPVAPHVPFLRPSPPAAVTPTPPVTAMKQPKQDRDVEVRIGTIEIRATVPSPAPPLSEPAPVLGDPAEGLESYRSLRRYSSWFRG